MLSREERILGEILLSRGIVARATVESCARVRNSAPEGSSLLELIEKTGATDRSALAEAAAEARDLDRALVPALPKDARLGDFRVIREIGRGGMGIVYEAVQEPLGRRVALKVLPAPLSLDERRALRFLREARAAARLYHPGIVPIHASGSAEGILYFAMELIEGETVADALKRGPLPVPQAAQIAVEVARALVYAHDAGLVHRDIKPENILIGRDGHARVADFGLVQETLAGSLTLSGHVLGSPAFLAPEQAQGEDVDARADIYAVGAVLYTMLCGHPPYSGVIPSAVIGKVLHEDPPELRERSPGVPPELATICRRAMARDPSNRYPTASAFAAALESFVSGTGMGPLATNAAPRVSSDEQRRWAHGTGMRRLLLPLSALAGVLVLAWIGWRQFGPNARKLGERATAASVALPKTVAAKGRDCCAHAGAPGCERLDLDLGTGVDDTVSSPGPIAAGRPDDDWWVLVDPNGDPVPRRAEVVTPHPRWRELPGSRWISANVFGRNGVYVYETCFCVGRGIQESTLGIGFLGDDFVTAVRLNGTPLTMPPAPKECSYEWEPCQIIMSDASKLMEGRNCLDIEVTNVGGSPTGLVVSANVRGEYQPARQ